MKRITSKAMYNTGGMTYRHSGFKPPPHKEALRDGAVLSFV